jgi:rfaE bifunctional protein nucleotidyltransferase chain/domain
MSLYKNETFFNYIIISNMENIIFTIQDKVYLNLFRLQDDLNYWKAHNKKIVFTNGCFDILHRGHIEYLINAKELGDILIIGLNSDNSVKKLKGDNRPINDQMSRALILASLMFVDAVVIFDEETPLNLIKMVNPDILVKGSDYISEDIVGYDFVKENDGEILTIDLVQGFSTTDIIKKL